MSKETQTPEKQTYIRDLFNVSEEREAQLEAQNAPFIKQYKNSTMTNCKVLESCLALVDSQEEKQFVAFLVAGNLAAIIYNPFNF